CDRRLQDRPPRPVPHGLPRLVGVFDRKGVTSVSVTQSFDTTSSMEWLRSERRLFEEVHINLAYRWFCWLGLGGDVVNHSAFSTHHHSRFRDSNLLRERFEATVRPCISEAWSGSHGFTSDANASARPKDWTRSIGRRLPSTVRTIR